MPEVDTAGLRALAEAARMWYPSDDHDGMDEVPWMDTEWWTASGLDERHARFIAAADPPTILALLDAAADAERKLAAVAEIAGDLWRASPCGCGHRADLHSNGTFDPPVCQGGLGLCSCGWSFYRIVETRLTAVLAPAEEESRG